MITALHLTTSGDDTSDTVFTTASITPSPYKLVLVAVSTAIGTGPPVPTLAGCNMTWEVVRNKLDAGSLRQITVFRGLIATPSAGALTITFASAVDRCGWSVSEFGEVDTTGTNGSGAIVQSADNTLNTTATGITVTLAAFGSTNNATYGAMRFGTNGVAISPGSGFTELGEADLATSAIETEWRTDNDTSVDWSWASTNTNVEAIAIEIKAGTVSAQYLKERYHNREDMSGVSLG